MSNPEPNAPTANILVIDDDPENLRLFAGILSDRGHIIRPVTDGRLALAAAQAEPPDLILLDIMMPGMNGYQVCERLKADKRTRDIPILFISALGEVFDKVKAFAVGGVDYITKPFHVEEAIARVENQLTIQRLYKNLQQEIQERRKAEQAAQTASQAKSEFLANISHELRTPLNAILGFTQVMKRDGELSTKQQDYLEIISYSGEHLLELINDVLALSKIESGLISLNISNFDLYRLLDNIEEMFQIKTEQKNLQLIFLVQPDVPQYIRSDEKKLRACLINLLSNAIKFTDYGRVSLRVKRELQTEGKTNNKQQTTNNKQQTTITFEVEDTGLGIAPEEMTGLFDAFVQTQTGKKSAEGTGLGLAIAQKFVQLMGGTITVESVVGEGSIFKFEIHFTEADSSEVIAQPLRRIIGLEPNQGVYRILVVDDTRENRLLLVELLQPIGFEIEEAINGEEAVALWLSWQPHLIFMDTRMPVMNGLEATRQIRARERERGEGERGRIPESPSLVPSSHAPCPMPHAQTIIIALTASAFEEKRGEILAAGSNDFIHKPFREEEIFAKLAEYLGVRYIYEDLLPSTVTSRQFNAIAEKPDSFFLAQFKMMPLTWVVELNRAANTVKEETILQLIEQISQKNPSLAEALINLIEDFRLDTIVRLTQLAINDS